MKSGDSGRTQHRQSSALLTLEDLAAECRVSYWTARAWVESGKLPSLRLPGDRLIRIRRRDFERFVEALT